MNENQKDRRHKPFVLASALTLAWLVVPALLQAKRRTAGPGTGEEFFIVSSLEAKKKQIVLKHPTEVTELVHVNDQTTYTDADGHPLRLEDLRAGDTVYVVFAGGSGGTPVVVRLRRGPMTVEELHRRYFKTVTRED